MLNQTGPYSLINKVAIENVTCNAKYGLTIKGVQPNYGPNPPFNPKISQLDACGGRWRVVTLKKLIAAISIIGDPKSLIRVQT